MRYFQIRFDNASYADRWLLGDPLSRDGEEIDPDQFTCGEPYKGPPPRDLHILHPGRAVAFNFCPFLMPVVTSEVADTIELVAKDEIERFPVLIEAHPGYEILNVVHCEPCLDEDQSAITRWNEGDGVPHKLGEPAMVIKLVVDPVRAKGLHILRIANWQVALLVSDRLKAAIEGFADLGVVFKPTDAGSVYAPVRPKYLGLYGRLFSPLIRDWGEFDEETLTSIVGFDAGGPLSFRTIGGARGERFVTYVSCELAVRQDQRPSAFGRYELLATCDDEAWVRSILTRIGRMSLEVVLGHLHTLDIGEWVAPEASIQAVVMERVTESRIEGQHYAVFRCLGITRPELEYALTHGPEDLLAKLELAGVTRTTANRESII